MLLVARALSCLLVVSSLLACKGDDTSGTRQLIVGTPSHRSGDGGAPAITVALVMKTLTNPFFKAMEKGARRAEEELGVRLLVRTGAKETSIEQQIGIVEELIRERVDAIVIAPASSTELVPVLAEARGAGIVIINIDNRVEPALWRERNLPEIPFISVNNEHGAYLSAQALVARLGKPAKVAIIEGIRSAQNAQDRAAGARRAFAETPGIELVASETAHWKLDESYQVTSRLISSHPHLGALFCANDMMALGAIRYLDEVGRRDVLVAGYDALDEARRALRLGRLVATVDQRADRQGYLGVSYAVRVLRGETVPPETLVDVELVTTDTMDTP